MKPPLDMQQPVASENPKVTLFEKLAKNILADIEPYEVNLTPKDVKDKILEMIRQDRRSFLGCSECVFQLQAY